MIITILSIIGVITLFKWTYQAIDAWALGDWDRRAIPAINITIGVMAVQFVILPITIIVYSIVKMLG